MLFALDVLLARSKQHRRKKLSAIKSRDKFDPYRIVRIPEENSTNAPGQLSTFTRCTGWIHDVYPPPPSPPRPFSWEVLSGTRLFPNKIRKSGVTTCLNPWDPTAQGWALCLLAIPVWRRCFETGTRNKWKRKTPGVICEDPRDYATNKRIYQDSRAENSTFYIENFLPQ